MDVGEKLGKYEIRGTLGRGAMGVVYDAWDPLIERRVAIKTVRLTRGEDDAEAQEALARFRREAQAAGRLQHPNIVGVYDYGEIGDFAYLVMEFVDGRTIKAALDAQERFPVPEVARIMGELLSALQYSHDHGVVHRDIKPANMILTRDGRVKIADFGVARIESSSMTQVGTVIGTPAYMSPEQLAGQTVDSRSDIYSSGVVLYQLLTGDRPYHGNTLSAIYHQALNSEPVPPSKLSVTVPLAFDPVVARAMAKRPQDRYASAGQFAEAVREAVTSHPAPPLVAEPDATIVARPAESTASSPPAPTPVATPPGPADAPSHVVRPSNRTALFAAVAAVFLLAVAGGAWYASQSGGPRVGAAPPSRPAPSSMPAASSAPASSSTVKPPALVIPSTTPAKPPVTGQPNQTQSGAPAASVTTTPAIVQPTSPPAQPSAQAPSQTSVSHAPPTQLAWNLGSLRSAIAGAVVPVGCTLVQGKVADSGTVSLVGVAGRGFPMTQLYRAVSDAAPSVPVDWRVASFDGPYCRALDVLRPVADASGAAGGGFTMALRSGARALVDGDLITLDLVMPSFPAWLRVDYLQHDGTVVHLHPTAKDPARSYPPFAHVSLGDPAAGGERWEVGSPYGVDMVIAVASSAPLFAQPRKEMEPGEVYIRALQTAIEAAERRNDRLAADALVLTTQPKR